MIDINIIEQEPLMDEDQAAFTAGLCLVALLIGLMIGIVVMGLVN